MENNAQRAYAANAGAETVLNLVRQDRRRPEKRPHEPVAELFTEREGRRCVGVHLLVDLYGASRLDDLDLIESTLVRCVDIAGATLLHLHLHPFEPNGGVSGVAVLAESHISIHTWPEKSYAALDLFMCGKARPERCIEVLLDAFSPERAAIEEILRGRNA